VAIPVPTNNLEGKAEFYDGERIDTRLRSEHLKPTAEFLRQRELAQLAKAANEAAERGLQTSAQKGIAQAEQYANTPDINQQCRDYIAAVSERIPQYRQLEVA